MTTQQSIPKCADEVLRHIELRAHKQFLPIIGPRKGALLAEEIRRAKPCHVLEVGTLIGYSAVLIGRELNADAEILTIEIHGDEAEEAGRNIVEAAIAPKVKIVVGDAKEVIPTLTGYFDFAFIDAEKTEYVAYLKLAEPRLRAGAAVFADNAGIFADQMGEYLDYVRNSGKYRSRYVQVGDDGVEISVKL